MMNTAVNRAPAPLQHFPTSPRIVTHGGRAMTLRQSIWSVSLGVAVVALAGCDIPNLHAQGVDGTFERTLTVTGPADLDVRTGSGDIQIRAGSDNSVHVVGHIRAHVTIGLLGPLNPETPEQTIARIQAHPPVEQTGNAVRI